MSKSSDKKAGMPGAVAAMGDRLLVTLDKNDAFAPAAWVRGNKLLTPVQPLGTYLKFMVSASDPEPGTDATISADVMRELRETSERDTYKMMWPTPVKRA